MNVDTKVAIKNLMAAYLDAVETGEDDFDALLQKLASFENEVPEFGKIVDRHYAAIGEVMGSTIMEIISVVDKE